LTIDLLVNPPPQVLHAVDANSLVAEVAPLPEDIIWANMHLRWRER
jgi:hypothetical protein